MKPRQDQEQAIAYAADAIAVGRRAVLQLPTGSGKTLCALLMAKRWLGPQRRVYMLTPSVQALNQAVRMGQFLGIRVAADQGERCASKFAPFIVSTYSTAWKRHKRIPRENTFLILDECHHVNYAAPINVAMLESFKTAVGLSATPWSIGCQSYFGNNCHILPLSHAISVGINCAYEITDWHQPSCNGNYQVIYSKRISKKHPLLAGISSADYAVYTRGNSAAVIDRFRRGFVRTLLVDRMLTEGFDLKQIKHIYVDKLVMSRILLMQMLGRALRPFGDKKAVIAIRHKISRQRLLQALKRAG